VCEKKKGAGGAIFIFKMSVRDGTAKKKRKMRRRLAFDFGSSFFSRSKQVCIGHATLGFDFRLCGVCGRELFAELRLAVAKVRRGLGLGLGDLFRVPRHIY
jgi:hypothetical protein